MWRRCGGLDLAMCGICGMVALDGGAVDERAVRAMADALVHRGPDSEGVFADGPVGLAARRLAIIALARGDQPMRNEDGSVVAVQNGELYDHRSVQAALEQRGLASRRPATRRCCRTCTRSAGSSSSTAFAGCSRSPSGTRRSAGC